MSYRGSSVRRATAIDAPSVRSLARLLATSFSIDDEVFNRLFNRLMGNDDARILVSVNEFGAVNGYLLGFVHDAFFANGTVAWIEEMYVSDATRRNGIGRTLEKEFEAWARNRDARLIALATRRAASFYSAIGYEESAVYFRRVLYS
jgi:GNAT superfamily N-acetyltransferase